MELLVAASISAIVVGATSQAYVSGMRTSETIERSRKTEEARIRFEDRLTKLLRAAWVSSSTTDTLSYFIGDNSTGQASGLGNDNADRMTFTVIGLRVGGAILNGENDFETLNRDFGPQGGVTEISISPTPVGSPPQTVQGLIIREQHPADGDTTQGGTESVLDSDVTQASFEFYNGTDWQSTWSTASGTRRLPAAVRITYQVQDEDAKRILVVRLPNSDVTSANPVTTDVTQ